jgi:hypothetical protein
MTETASDDLIELRVDNIAQLFHTLDPFPFRERDLDKEAEEFIVGWPRELAADRTIKIIIHFPEAEAQTKAARELEEAFRRYFSDHAPRYGARNQGAVSDRPSLPRDRRHDPDRLFAVGASRKRLPGREPVQTPCRRKFPDSWLGRKLASPRNIPV